MAKLQEFFFIDFIEKKFIDNVSNCGVKSN